MNYIVLDLETANPDCASICQIGIVRVENGEVVDTASHLIDPEDRFDHWNIKVHGIRAEHVMGSPTFRDLLPEIAPVLEHRIIVTHGSFDRTAMAKACQRYGLAPIEARWLDNQTVVRRTWPQFAKRGYSLGNLARHFGITFRHHDALEDAIATAHVFRRALDESGRTATDWASSTPRSSTASSILVQGDAAGPFSGRTVVFTGRMRVTRREAVRRAAELGFTVGAVVSPTTDLLCVGREAVERPFNVKMRDAERLLSGGHPLEIVTEDEFWQRFRP